MISQPQLAIGLDNCIIANHNIIMNDAECADTHIHAAMKTLLLLLAITTPLLAAASAIGEECLFRGALLLHLKDLLPGAPGYLLGLFGSSAIFALLHIGPGVRFLPWTLSALLMGLLLGIVFVSMGDLLSPIAIHFTVNLLNLQEIVRRPALA